MIQSPEVSSLLELCYKSTGVFGKAFMPDTFNTNFSSLHNEMLAAINSGHQKVAIAAPRGLGKTSCVRAEIMRSILYRDYEFISYISNSETVAEMQTENIKRELRTNREIRRIWGDVAINVDDPDMDVSFSKRSWVAFGNTFIIPRGSGQQVRGLLYKRFRPQLIVVDDLENREELMNPELRRKTKEWFHADVEKSVDRYSNKWRIIYIDTLKHSDALLQELLDSPDWYGVRLDLCDDEYNSKVPELFTTEELRREVESHRQQGLLHVFYMEYRNLPTSPEIASFREEYFKYYEERDLDPKGLESMIIVDPAKSPEIQSADSAVVGISANYRNGAIFIRDIVHGKMYPDQLYDEIFSMRRRLGAHVVGIEVTGLNEFIKQPILNEMSKRGPSNAFEPVWLKARGGGADGTKGKLLRIGSLLPYYRSGSIYHNKANCAALESQLLGFPRSGLLDVADATAYFIEMLELGSRYFSGPEEDQADIEKEYENIEYEDGLEEAEWTRI